IEYVHQLRVGTRRADAALRIFTACLPGEVYRKSRRRLRELRRAAGAARDWDVFLADLLMRGQEAGAQRRAGLDFLIGYAVGQRTAAHAQLEEVYQEQGPTFETFLAHLIDVVRPVHDAPAPVILVDLARPLLFDRLQ